MSAQTGVILAAGGTGGHIFPALSVAEALREISAATRILFVGGQGPEGGLAKKAGLEFTALPVAGIIGRGAAGAVALLQMGAALFTALGVVRAFKPSVVAGFGGYAAVCPTLAAALLGVPCAVQEQNCVPGRANRLLGRFVDAVFTAYPDETRAFSARKVERTGNPVRKDILGLAKNPALDKGGLNLLVLGGSQGARAVNDLVLAAWPSLEKAGVSLWHQTGGADLERMRAGYGGGKNVAARVTGFIDDMAFAFDWADLVLARSGASTLAELAVAGKPSLLVPFPFAAHDHQLGNARYLEQAGAALTLEQKNCTPDVLAAAVLRLFANREQLSRMGAAAKAQARPGAARDIAERLLGLAGKAAGSAQ
ncbi:MAG: undecaprenyldiphospho-muramoylpentapeptide beta-N-acetylglucosaminyltransferase [Desulfovibrionaceae bacterium]|nr:undecaprenyldiphospho-muramoylpentapeptide beta-N-acetylglucosaminyltransferase [Desulfovibrionaceae bacterium]MBF0514465.1 undecaprenyldiphospho-muramoylpentapeptide beta-N-acetylglucosaminyltransferase [Desulfovibrionaceae bacterium]